MPIAHIFPFFLGASLIKLAYTFMIQEVEYAEIN